MLYQLLLIANMVSSISISVIGPFFPPIAEEKGLSTQQVGIIFAVNPLGAFLASILLARSLTKDNRCIILLSGLLIQSLGLIMFLFVEQINDQTLLLTLTISARLLQGFGTAAFAVPVYGLIPVLYPKDVERRISVMEICSSIGYIAAPLLGGILYQFGGYKAPFLFFSAISLMSAPIIYKMLKKHLNGHFTKNKLAIGDKFEILQGEAQSQAETDNETIEEDSKKSSINFIEIFSNFSISLTFFVIIVSTFSYMYFEPIQSTFLIEKYDIDMNYIGYIMTICTVSYIGGTILIGCVGFPKKPCLLFGVLICSVTFFFQGPDESITKLDHNLTAVIIAQATLGFSCAMIFIPSLPLLNEILLTMYPYQYEKAGNLASILFNCAISCGEFIGPLVGGVMTDDFGYIHGCSYTGFGIMAIGIVYGCVLFKPISREETSSKLKVPILSKEEADAIEITSPRISYLEQATLDTTLETDI